MRMGGVREIGVITLASTIQKSAEYQRFVMRRIDVNELKEAMKLMGEDFQI